MHYFSIFFKRFNKPCVNFLRVWTKNANCLEILRIFDENSIEKMNFYFIFIFYFIFRKFVTKNRAFGNNTSFLEQFFRFRGGVSPFPLPGYALVAVSCLEMPCLKSFKIKGKTGGKITNIKKTPRSRVRNIKQSLGQIKDPSKGLYSLS